MAKKKIKHVVFENQTLYQLLLYWKVLDGKRLHVAVALYPEKATDLVLHTEYLLKPASSVNPPDYLRITGNWSDFDGIIFNARRVRTVHLICKQFRHDDDGEYIVLIQEKPN